MRPLGRVSPTAASSGEHYSRAMPLQLRRLPATKAHRALWRERAQLKQHGENPSPCNYATHRARPIGIFRIWMQVGHLAIGVSGSAGPTPPLSEFSYTSVMQSHLCILFVAISIPLSQRMDSSVSSPQSLRRCRIRPDTELQSETSHLRHNQRRCPQGNSIHHRTTRCISSVADSARAFSHVRPPGPVLETD